MAGRVRRSLGMATESAPSDRPGRAADPSGRAAGDPGAGVGGLRHQGQHQHEHRGAHLSCPGRILLRPDQDQPIEGRALVLQRAGGLGGRLATVDEVTQSPAATSVGGLSRVRCGPRGLRNPFQISKRPPDREAPFTAPAFNAPAFDQHETVSAGRHGAPAYRWTAFAHKRHKNRGAPCRDRFAPRWTPRRRSGKAGRAGRAGGITSCRAGGGAVCRAGKAPGGPRGDPENPRKTPRKLPPAVGY